MQYGKCQDCNGKLFTHRVHHVMKWYSLISYMFIFSAPPAVSFSLICLLIVCHMSSFFFFLILHSSVSRNSQITVSYDWGHTVLLTKLVESVGKIPQTKIKGAP